MAKAYYNDGGVQKRWTASMVDGVGYSIMPAFNSCWLYIGSYHAPVSNGGHGFTLLSTIIAGYNGNIRQQLCTIITFRFGNGMDILYNGWSLSLPTKNGEISYWYHVSGSQVDVYCKSDSYNSDDASIVFLSGNPDLWTCHSRILSSPPTDVVQFAEIRPHTSFDPQIVVSENRPTNANAALWVKV